MRLPLLITAITIAVSCGAASSRAQHADVRPDANCQFLTTNGWVDATSQSIPNLRVFGYDFQEDPDDPYFASDPGFNSVGASALPPGEPLRFNVLSGDAFGLASNLSYWNGIGQVNFGVPFGGETLTLRLSSNSVVVDGLLGEQAGFSIQTIGSTGEVHRHLSSILGGGIEVPAKGIYFVALELAVTGLQDSLPFFLVYNNDAGELAHDQAIDWVQSTFVYPLGDLNRDHLVSEADIPAMLDALVNLPAYQAEHNLSDAELFGVANIDGDCHITNADIQALLDLLSAGGGAHAVPEPAALVLAIVGGAVAIGLGRRNSRRQRAGRLEDRASPPV